MTVQGSNTGPEPGPAHVAGSLPDMVVTASFPPTCGGYLEAVHCSPVDGQALVIGWVSCPPDFTPWLEHASGWRLPLTGAFRHARQDLLQSDHPALGRVGGAYAAFEFCAAPVRQGDVLRLLLTRGTDQLMLAEVVATELPLDPLAAFNLMMGQPAALGWLTDRFRQVDWPLLKGLIHRQQTAFERLPLEVFDVGVVPAQPLLSLIVTLHKRFDLLEPQLLKFSQDPWLREHVELIYVLDDPSLAEPMRAQAPALWALYRMPFRWVWAWASRGLAAANNLGLAAAKAPNLVFMHSDVFPIQPGWAQVLLETLAQHPQLGAVAPRLLRADGSVEQAGQRYRHADELGVWLPQAIDRGLAPALCASTGMSEVPVLGSACLAVRRADLERVGAWDCGYLLGGFEGADLSLSLRQHGLAVACVHDVSLVHLAAQSASQHVADPAFAMKVELLNATRHQWRWAEQIHQLMAADGAC